MIDAGQKVSLHRTRIPTWLPAVLVVVVIVLGYGLGPSRLPLWGEETCRALHGIEMAESGDWLVATNQYEPILDRPPMQYWVLAAIHKWIHELDPITLRMSMLLTTLITALVVWWYARAFLDPAAAFLAAIAFPTMGHVLDLGRRVETDGLFTLFLVSSLLVWHYGYMRRWRPALTWLPAAGLAACAALTKGAQGPVAFFGTVCVFLLWRRDWRRLFHRSHAAAWVVFIAVIAIWQVPFYLREGWEGTRMTWFDPFSTRVEFDAFKLLRHLIEFPGVAWGASLPWSALLIAMLFPSFWQLDDRVKSGLTFVLIGIATILGPVWISVGGHQRYIMPMYPLEGIVCGVVLHQVLRAKMGSWIGWYWHHFARGMAIVLLGMVVVFGMATMARRFSRAEWIDRLSQPVWLTLLLLAAALAVGVCVARLSRSRRNEKNLIVVFTLTSLWAACFNGFCINTQTYSMMRIGPAVAALRRRLPPNPELLSFGVLHHRFLYHYYLHHSDQRVPIIDRPESPDDVPPNLRYFAVTLKRGETLNPPFDWTELACINMDRGQTTDPENRVVVGRRNGQNGQWEPRAD